MIKIFSQSVQKGRQIGEKRETVKSIAKLFVLYANAAIKAIANFLHYTQKQKMFDAELSFDFSFILFSPSES